MLQIKGRTTATRSWGTAPPRLATPARCRFALALAITRTTGLIHAYVCCRLSWTSGAHFGVPRQAPPTHQHPLASSAWRAPAPKVQSPPGNHSACTPGEAYLNPLLFRRCKQLGDGGNATGPGVFYFTYLRIRSSASFDAEKTVRADGWLRRSAAPSLEPTPQRHGEHLPSAGLRPR